jgi:hypothetical protein
MIDSGTLTLVQDYYRQGKLTPEQVEKAKAMGWLPVEQEPTLSDKLREAKMAGTFKEIDWRDEAQTDGRQPRWPKSDFNPKALAKRAHDLIPFLDLPPRQRRVLDYIVTKMFKSGMTEVGMGQEDYEALGITDEGLRKHLKKLMAPDETADGRRLLLQRQTAPRPSVHRTEDEGQHRERQEARGSRLQASLLVQAVGVRHRSRREGNREGGMNEYTARPARPSA